MCGCVSVCGVWMGVCCGVSVGMGVRVHKCLCGCLYIVMVVSVWVCGYHTRQWRWYMRGKGYMAPNKRLNKVETDNAHMRQYQQETRPSENNYLQN